MTAVPVVTVKVLFEVFGIGFGCGALITCMLIEVIRCINKNDKKKE